MPGKYVPSPKLVAIVMCLGGNGVRIEKKLTNPRIFHLRAHANRTVAIKQKQLLIVVITRRFHDSAILMLRAVFGDPIGRLGGVILGVSGGSGRLEGVTKNGPGPLS